ncbi:MAG: LPXTG cell wall anchor domain-containing protein [Actinobacteria bacterium]|nr:LPXTG cell wall anchor domain-containing protein [Actinomycetota bacterium]
MTALPTTGSDTSRPNLLGVILVLTGTLVVVRRRLVR